MSDASILKSVPRYKRILRWLRIALITLFILWHLTFLFIANAKLYTDLTSATLGKYERYTSLDQGWGMFSSPLYRVLPFPAVRVTFDDGSSEVILSSNEPEDLKYFFRIGGARLRKLEHSFIAERADLTGDYRQPIQQRLAQSYLDRWKAAHPEDARRAVKFTLIRRDFQIPRPGESWADEPVVTEKELASFAVEGAP